MESLPSALGELGLPVCVCAAVSTYNTLDTAASITHDCCDAGGKAQTHAAEGEMNESVWCPVDPCRIIDTQV